MSCRYLKFNKRTNKISFKEVAKEESEKIEKENKLFLKQWLSSLDMASMKQLQSIPHLEEKIKKYYEEV